MPQTNFVKTNPSLNETLTWFVFYRLCIATLLLISTLFYLQQPNYIFSAENILPMLSLIAITFLFNFLYLLAFNQASDRASFTYLQITYDICFISSLILITDTEDSIFTVFYLIIIILAAMTERLKGALFATVLTCFFYLLVLYLGHELYFFPITPRSVAQVIGFIITGALSGYMVQELRQKNADLAQITLELVKTKDLQNLIFKHLDCGLILITLEGKIIHCNQTALQMLQVREQSQKDEQTSTEGHQELKNLFVHLPQWLMQFEKQMAQAPAVFTQNLQLPQKIGSHYFNFHITPLYLEKPRYNGVLITVFNITPLQELQEKMQHQERLASIGRLSSALAHEIRNPLASISGSCELLQSSSLLPTEDKRLLQIITRESDRLNGLISDLMDYVRIDKTPAPTVDLLKIIHEVHEECLVQPIFKNISLVFTGTENTALKIKAHAHALKQVLLNLLLNAAQAMPAERLKADMAEHKCKIEVKWWQQQEKIRISIQDNGAGIAPDNMKHLFEPFFTTKKIGTGLGLATVFKIIQDHQGHIDVQSKLGEGTCFRLDLPHNASLELAENAS